MSPLFRKALFFTAGAALGAAVWSWVERMHHPDTSATVFIVDGDRKPAWKPSELKALVHELDDESVAADSLRAAQRLECIPIEEIPAALDSLTSSTDFDLSLSAKILLVRWGGADGEAASRWAWRRFNAPATWEKAFREIAPAWEWHDSRAFGKWALETPLFQHNQEPGAKRSAGDEPLMSPPLLQWAAECLLPDQPRLAFEALWRSTYPGEVVGRMIGRLQSSAQIREALAVFKPQEGVGSENFTGSSGRFEDQDMLEARKVTQALLQRWKQIDPEDFGRSEFASKLQEPPPPKPLASVQFKEAPPEGRAEVVARILQEARPMIRGNRLNSMVGIWMEQDPQQCFDWIVEMSTPRESSPPPIPGILSVAYAAWNGRHQGEDPDQSGWPQERIEDWQDLKILSQAGRR